MPPRPQFTHEFVELPLPGEAEAVSRADVIFACLPRLDIAGAAADLSSRKKDGAQLILLTEGAGAGDLSPQTLAAVSDIWPASLSEEEARFRFSRWQSQDKAQKDLWEARQFLEATINSVPSLIWYKDKEGVHEKVNDSFCATVNKTKEQVQGRRHAYIWDVERDDPVCIESEEQVMRTKTTLVSRETVLTGGGQRLLTTYKSPLYDLDGEVMGTVGVGIDVTQEQLYAQELENKTSFLEGIFTSLDCGVMCHSLDGSRVLSVNQAALHILGYASAQELIEDGFHIVANSVAKEDQEPLKASIMQLTEPGDSVNVEYQVVHKDGSRLHVMGNVKLVEENGELFYQRFLLDCTAQKLQEQREREAAERRQMELVHALSTDYSLVCVFDLDTGLGSTLRISNCEHDMLATSLTPTTP